MVRGKNILGHSFNPAGKLVIRELDDNVWLFRDLFSLIRRHGDTLAQLDHLSIQVGPKKIKPFPDMVFDCRNPLSAYRLAEKIVRQGGVRGKDIWDGFFKTPRAIILPPTTLYDRTSQRAEFHCCAAQGEKGQRAIVPFVSLSHSRYDMIQPQGEQIVVMSECSLQRVQDDAFHLTIRPLDQIPHMVPLRLKM